MCCDACQVARCHQLPYSTSEFIPTAPLELICSDVWGPTSQSSNGNKYYVSFIDVYSKFTWIFLISYKSDVFAIFLAFKTHVEKIIDKSIKHVQIDWGEEYLKLNQFFNQVGINHSISCPHTHQQNGIAECKHRHVVEVSLALLAHSHLPLKY